jgi:hypothetical protein
MLGQPMQSFAQSNTTIRNDAKRVSVSDDGSSQDTQRRAQASPATDANKKKAELAKEVARQQAELEKLKREADEKNDRSGFGKFAGGLVGDDAGRGATAASTTKSGVSPSAIKPKDPVKDSVKASADPCAIAVNPCKPKK